MDLLKRELAPITGEAWQQVDEEARRVLRLHLAGRKLVDFSGPHGWQLGAVNTGRLLHIQATAPDTVAHAIREVRHCSSCAAISCCSSWSSTTQRAAPKISISTP